VRHDAVAWGYARGASSRGVDIIQNCEVTGLEIVRGRIAGVKTSRDRSARARWPWRSPVRPHAWLRWPGSRFRSRATSSRPLCRRESTAHSLRDHIRRWPFLRQPADKGGLVFGGDIDGYNSYAQRGNLPVVEDVCEGGMALMPMIGRIRVLRNWGGLLDMSMDGSPIIDRTPIDGLYLNCGWCYGGFNGDTGLGPVLCTPDCAGRSASGRSCLSSGSLRSWRADRREGRRRPTQSSLRLPMRIPCPYCGSRDLSEFVYHGGDATPKRPRSVSDERIGVVLQIRLSAGESGWADLGALVPREWVPLLAHCDPRHAHPRHCGGYTRNGDCTMSPPAGWRAGRPRSTAEVHLRWAALRGICR